MLYLRIALLLVFFTSCESESKLPSERCEKSTVIDHHEFSSPENKQYQIEDAKITGDCLKISFSASGCSGDTWDVHLVESGIVNQSSPTKRYLKLSLENSESCEALLLKEVSFNLRQLQLNSSVIVFKLQGYDEEIEYRY